MNTKLKSVVKQSLNKAGYDLIKNSTPYPYVRSCELCGFSFNFWIADEYGHLWYEEVSHNFEGEAKQLLKLVRPGARVLEFGCHHGYVTMMLALAVGADGYICAVEAAPENALVAQAQVTLNSFGRQCTVINRAGADNLQSVLLTRGQGARNTNSQVAYHASEDTILVEAVTGDDLASQYGPFDLLKIDVEGFEGKILSGCREILSKRPKIAMELHLSELSKFETDMDKVLRLIDIEGYNGTMIMRPDYNKVHPFDPTLLTGSEPVNLFLTPKE